ncbi:acyltransferase [Actinosynnema pretiosum subsp. pretiosum]|uniref:Acyltransferase n=1 Tax=Actinosynnema pretiosum subsp. pretiosum TaxID=103721 RepID=A0AA45LBJ0_9PSEU|nr:acyltransferase [Actinosynnema pretiosum subsp. pretiosum]
MSLLHKPRSVAEKLPPPPTGPAAHDKLPSLTGLRFVTAFVVFGFHVDAMGLFEGTALDAPVHAVFGQGATGVGFFFLLSGFVLTWSARTGTTARASWRRRAAKVLPNHVVVWLLALAALVVTSGGAPALPSLVGLPLLQAWVPVQDVYFGVNTPAWSLSCEVAFYAAFPPLLRRVTGVRPSRLWPLAGALVAAVLLVPVLATPMPGELEYWFVYVFPVTRGLEFALGMVLARVVKSGLWPPLALWQAGALSVAAYALSGHLPDSFGYVAGTVVPLALLIPAAAVADLRAGRSPLRSRPLVLLGEISFAFYLLHQLVLRVAESLLPLGGLTAAGALLMTGLLLLASLAAAWLLHRFVEQPAMRLLTASRARV